jgi:hypothetical protein
MTNEIKPKAPDAWIAGPVYDMAHGINQPLNAEPRESMKKGCST